MTTSLAVSPASGDDKVFDEPKRLQQALSTAARTAAAAAAAVAVIAVLLLALGANPLSAFRALYDGAVGSPFALGQTIMLASVLCLTALAAAIPFSARMWNVGAEGQLYIGAVASVAVAEGAPDSLPHALKLILIVLAGAVGGGIWGFIPGALRALLGANEVIVSLMLTFIAVLFTGYATLSIWPSGLGQQTVTLEDDWLFPKLPGPQAVSVGALLALIVVGIAWFLMARSTLGFKIRAVGLNSHAADLAGISVSRVRIGAFTLGGICAGLGGSILIAGWYSELIAGSALGFGFLGIAAALVARLSPAWIVPSALLFAGLTVGSNALQVEAGISPAVASVLVGAFVVGLLAFGVVRLTYPEAAE